MKKSETIERITRTFREDVRTKSCLFPVRLWTAPWLSLFLILPVALTLSTSSLSQSGRQKPTTNSNTNNNASTRQTSKSTTNNRPSPKTDGGQTNVADQEDVVRVASYLVPVPATVVDARGVAVTNLKLEDFELRIDGQPDVISDLSRAETPVRMAMLFDNSGSLSESREFEKRAAIRFFRNVLRPVDQAAVFSVSTDVTLAEPLTNDERRLESTIADFGTQGATP